MVLSKHKINKMFIFRANNLNKPNNYNLYNRIKKNMKYILSLILSYIKILIKKQIDKLIRSVYIR